jgi:hypothetical protein
LNDSRSASIAVRTASNVRARARSFVAACAARVQLQQLGDLGARGRQDLVGGHDAVEPSRGDRVPGLVALRIVHGPLEMGGREALAADLDREVRHRDPDRDLVRHHAIRPGGADAVVRRQQQERPHRDRVPVARDDDRRRELEKTFAELETGDHHVGRVGTAGHHRLQVEAGRERLRAPGQDHGHAVRERAVEGGVQLREHRDRQRVSLAVVHRDGGDAVFVPVRDERAHGVPSFALRLRCA